MWISSVPWPNRGTSARNRKSDGFISKAKDWLRITAKLRAGSRQRPPRVIPLPKQGWELHEAGQGVAKDFGEALRLYRSAAEKGYAGAQYTLGFLYESGRGVRQDHAEAARWYQLAAEQGDPLSQYDLGQRYALGVGVKQDMVEAGKWLSLAARQGQEDAKLRFGALKKSLTRQEFGEIEKRVKAFLPTNRLASAVAPSH
jgi:hypothetical protein